MFWVNPAQLRILFFELRTSLLEMKTRNIYQCNYFLKWVNNIYVKIHFIFLINLFFTFLENTCTNCENKKISEFCFFREGKVLPIWRFYKKNKKWFHSFEVAIFIMSLFLKNLLSFDNFDINNKAVIPNNFMLVFEIQIKRKMC